MFGSADSFCMQDWLRVAQSWWQAGQAAGAHGREHVERVLGLMRHLAEQEGFAGPDHALVVAAYGHDVVQVPKQHPDRRRASFLAGRFVAGRLGYLGYPPRWLGEVTAAIRDHSFSAGRVPQSLLGELLQDADRLEALGMIGWVRMFATAGEMGSQLWHAADPLASGRSYDDRAYALDHLEVKLAGLPTTMRTASGRALAEQRLQRLYRYRDDLLAEVRGDA